MLKDGGKYTDLNTVACDKHSPSPSLSVSLFPSRLFADVLNDVGKFLELLAPIFPNFFLLLVCKHLYQL